MPIPGYMLFYGKKDAKEKTHSSLDPLADPKCATPCMKPAKSSHALGPGL